MRPLYIFDLDGTLALTEHRQHILDSRDDPDRWRKFFAACVGDGPNVPVIHTLFALSKAQCDTWIWSGRSDEVRSETEAWLAGLGIGPITGPVRMRAAGDFTPDEELKMGWLKGLPAKDRIRLVAIFDDRDKVVSMWRAAGVPCFQVAPGAF